MIDPNLQHKMFLAAKAAGRSAGFDLYSVVVQGPEITYTWSDGGFPERQYRVIEDAREISGAQIPDGLIEVKFERHAHVMKESLSDVLSQ